MRQIGNNNKQLFITNTQASNHLKASIYKQESKKAHKSRINHNTYFYSILLQQKTWPLFTQGQRIKQEGLENKITLKYGEKESSLSFSPSPHTNIQENVEEDGWGKMGRGDVM